MIEAQVVINKSWDYMPEGAQETWHELPRDIDAFVSHDFIRDVLKPGLIRVYQAFTAQLKEKGLQPHEIAGIIEHQGNLLEAIGLIEVYFSEFN